MKKFLIVLFVLISISEYNFAQVKSVYSKFGIGNLEYSNSVRKAGMGDLGSALDDYEFISSLNPAAISELNLTRVEFSGKFNSIYQKDYKSSTSLTTGGFSSFGIGFPISRDNGISLSFGLNPYSIVDYSVKEEVFDEVINKKYTKELSGDGGISRLYLNLSYKLPFGLRLGAGLDYFFGNIDYNSKLLFDNNDDFSSTFLQKNKVKGTSFSFGVISPNISSLIDNFFVDDLKFAVSIQTGGELTNSFMFTKQVASSIDTINSFEGTFNLPIRLIYGLSFSVNKSFVFHFDYLNQAWTKFKHNGLTDNNLQDVNKISFGVEYQKDKLGQSFNDLTIWRLGFSYEQTPFKINNKSINELSFAAGVSLPLSRENTVDFSLQYVTRGEVENSLIKENFIKFGFGISLGELWFIQQER